MLFLKDLPDRVGNTIYNQLQSGEQPDMDLLVRRFKQQPLGQRNWSSDNFMRIRHAGGESYRWVAADKNTGAVSRKTCIPIRHYGWCAKDGGMAIMVAYSQMLADFYPWKPSLKSTWKLWLWQLGTKKDMNSCIPKESLLTWQLRTTTARLERA